MTTHSLILSPHETRAALRGELGLVVRPVKSQPTNGLKWNAVVLNGYGGWTDEHDKPFPCPLGVPGGRLVCKETWKNKWGREFEYQERIADILYRADGEYLPAGEDPANERWRSPATMPLWASRIMLEVVGVRCVRFGELSHADAKLCGLIDDGLGHFIPMQRFWNAKYAKRGLGWETNPFVWAGGVRRVEA